MGVKITLTDPERARECVQWLMKDVGPIKRSVGGPVVHGEGWVVYMGGTQGTATKFFIEVDDFVDEDTQLLFALKWS